MNADAGTHARWHALPGRFRALAMQGRGAVLLETAKFDEENFRSLLFVDPVCELIAESAEQVAGVFHEIDEALARGQYVAGFVSYECGYALHGMEAAESAGVPLIRVAVFAERVVFDHRSGAVEGTLRADATAEVAAGEAAIEGCTFEISREDYAERVGRVQQYLQDGHSYQVNFTDRVSGAYNGTPMALYEHLIERQPVAYAGYMECGDFQVLSFSPELFYRATGERIVVKPMKGTWPRGVDAEDDARAAAALRNDAKNCAEHVTIVDLLRNDLGRICAAGCVRVEQLMHVERYSTLHQMTSTIAGVPARGVRASEIFRALFPSGSITGAPKRRTMEIIRELERQPRGVYTGAMGWFGPGGEACFNVAIRTVVTRDGRYAMGVGGGITLDSDPLDEYRECELKAAFLSARGVEFYLIETMRAEGGVIALLERHMERLRGSAAYFQAPFDEADVRRLIAGAIEQSGEGDARVRLTLDMRGQAAVECTRFSAAAWEGKVLIANERTAASDALLYHKTSRRQRYDSALRAAQESGFDEVLFFNQEGCLTEGAISNVVLRCGGRLVTPAVRCGVLPGVQRGHILSTTECVESACITLADVRAADGIWLCNALRGTRPVRMVCDGAGNIVWRMRGGDIRSAGRKFTN